MLDIFIKNATIVDGSGSAPYLGCVGIQDGKISLVTAQDTHAAANTVLDGTGLHITPGFIDCHSHGDQVIGQEQAMLSKISQGITTEITGQCGASIFPVNPGNLQQHQSLVSIGTYTYPADMPNWTGFEAFARFAEKTPLAIHMKAFTGHSALRVAAMGYKEGKPTRAELENMKAMLRETMEHGSMGLSSGLIYPPGCYADTAELTELAGIAAKYGGMYATHMRNESDSILAAVREALEIGRRAGIPVCISHHKICGRQNWGLSVQTLELIHDAIASGTQVTIDQYPYTASSTYMNICIPPQYFENGGIQGMLQALRTPDTRKRIREEMQQPGTYDNFYINAGGFGGMFISGCPKTPEADGMLVSEYAQAAGKDGFDAFFDLLLANEGHVNGIFHCISDEDNIRIISDANATIGTDGTCRTLQEQTHPRTFGTFPRAIRHYVREKKVMALEVMVRKMTGFAAERMGLGNKGRIAQGYDADMVLFSYEELQDTADYMHSTLLSDGIAYVLVNGEIGYAQKQMTAVRAGKFLRHCGIVS